MAETRRKVLPLALFGALGTRIGILVATKEDYVPPATSSFSPEAAIEASRAAAQCPVQSCNQNRLTEMRYLLDTSKATANAKGTAATHKPIVWVEPAKQDDARPYAAKIVMAVPPGSDDAVQLMWLVNTQTQQIIGSKVIEGASSQAGVMSGAAAQGVGDGPPTLVASAKKGFAGVEAGTTVQPYVLYANDGLWAGTPFTLCGPTASSCPGALGPRDFPLDTRGRRPRGAIGDELLRGAAALGTAR